MPTTTAQQRAAFTGRNSVFQRTLALEIQLMSGVDVTEEAAFLLEVFDTDLAQAWREQPFRRADFAAAFSAGFGNPDNECAKLVRQAAEQDREAAQAATLRQQVMRLEVEMEVEALGLR